MNRVGGGHSATRTLETTMYIGIGTLVLILIIVVVVLALRRA
jgi:hypothetical protein